MGFVESTLQWVDNMLLCDMIRLRDVPKEIRTASSGVYITALRMSRSISCERFVQDLKVLALDIYTMPDSAKYKTCLIDLLRDELSMNNYTGVEAYERFREDLYPELIQALQRSQDSVRKLFQDFKRESGTVPSKQDTASYGYVE